LTRRSLGLLLTLAGAAQAESGRINLNADLGIAAPFTGRYGTAVGTNYAAQAFGPQLAVGVDYQLFRPLSLEVMADFGVLLLPSWLSIRNLEKLPAATPTIGLGVGPRFRFLDTDKGNLWASAHIGARLLDGGAFSADLGVGYQFTVLDRLGIGPFARGLFAAPGLKRGATVMAVIGVSASFDLVPFPVPPPPDDDGDSLTNDAELNVHHTDPRKADTDGDGLRDDVELAGKTDPLKKDTDGDGVADDVELARKTNPLAADTDGDGLTDEVELGGKTDPLKPDTDGDALTDKLELTTNTDPTKTDTDGDGVADGDEDKNHDGVVDEGETDPRVAPPPPPPDTDGDGLPDPSDNCPAVAGPPDNQGCPKEQKQLVVITKEKIEILEKVYFATRDASVLPKSFPLLDQVAAVLKAHPEIKKVQIEGHTDNVGDPQKNLALSQKRADAVFKYLSQKVEPARLEPIGYGPARPADTNDTPVGREKNRRVEFKIVGD